MGGKNPYGRLAALLLAYLAVAAIAAASSHNHGTLIGNISDELTALPIAGANISLESTSASDDRYSNLSGQDGSYSVSSIRPANYNINATRPGYKPFMISNQPINPFQTIAINFSLAPDAQQQSISGYVLNATYDTVANATVTVAAANRSAKTDQEGFYFIANVTAGTYDLVASKWEDGYEDAVALAQIVPGAMINFTLLKPRQGCNDDCTKDDGLCYPECGGRGKCRFYTQETAKACSNAAPGIVDYNELQKVQCCTGAPYTPFKATPRVSCGESVISIRLPVLFKGRFATMVLTVFDALGCSAN